MNNLRRIGAGIAVFLLLLSLLAVPLLVSLQGVVNSSATVKASLDKSGMYNASTGADLLLENDNISPAVISDQGIASALNNVITPSYIKGSSEKLLDNMYSYIHGDAPSPQLSIDVSDVKARFADNVAVYVKQKFNSLPTCKELMIPSTSLESLLQTPCVPIGVSSQQASEHARNEIMHITLFSNDRLDASTLVGIREASLNSALRDVRSAYPLFFTLVWALPILGVILAVAVLFLSDARRQGAKKVAKLLMSAGLINVVVGFIMLWLAEIVLGDSIQGGSTLFDSFEIMIQDLLSSLRIWWMGIAALFVVVSIVVFIALGVAQRPHLETNNNR